MVIWSLSITKLTPVQFKILIYLFQDFLSAYYRAGFWLKGLGMKTGHRLLCHSLPHPSKLGSSFIWVRGAREDRCGRKGKCLFTQLGHSSCCHLCFGKRAGIFIGIA
jgi:hypothetical protein